MITQVRAACGAGRVRVNGVCVARTTIRHVRSINLTYAAGGHGRADALRRKNNIKDPPVMASHIEVEGHPAFKDAKIFPGGARE
jgi:hypothetical protein